MAIDKGSPCIPAQAFGRVNNVTYEYFNFTYDLSDVFTNDSIHCLRDRSTPSLSLTMAIYSYTTPILILCGLLGNTLSLTVFLSRTMRRVSASNYLSALAVSDIVALICFVLVDWLRRGAPNLQLSDSNSMTSSSFSLFEVQGLCQVQMYFSYVSRFLSAWLVVTFTIERYLAVCHPLKRHGLFGSRSSKKIILTILFVSLIISIYKPLLTGIHEYRVQGKLIDRCSRNPSYPILSFALDSIFAFSISFVPFFIIGILNTLIVCRLRRRFRGSYRLNVITTENIIRMEFTAIFLVISFVFIALNLPFFCFWCYRFLLSFYNNRLLSIWSDTYQNLYLVSRMIFYTNYSINFFLYSVSGSYFRRQLSLMFVRRNYGVYNSCSRLSKDDNNHESNQSTPRSWV